MGHRFVAACGRRLTPCLLVGLAALASSAAGEEKLHPLATVGPKPKPVTPPTFEELEASITRGVNFLVADQNQNGSWGSATRTKQLNIYAPVPGAHHAFRTAVTALAISALIDADDRREEVLQAIDRGEAYLVKYLPRVRRASGDALYNVWTHAYAIQTLVQLYHRAPEGDERRQQYLDLIAQQIDLLGRYAVIDGGWGYYDFVAQAKQPSGSSISFTTATCLIALHDAKSIGAEVPQKMVDKAIAAINRQKKPDFSYFYGEYLKTAPMHPINRPAGSLGRSQACNYALRIYGDKTVTDEVVRTWVDRLIARNGWLSVGRKKPIPHESFFAIAGYFYYYGQYYGAYCIDFLPAAERRKYKGHLSAILLPLQEKDGSWWDYPLYNYHQQWGTSMAVSTLARCR